MARFTQTQQTVLAGLRMATEVAAERHAQEWPGEPTPSGYLFDLASIVRAANAGRQRRISEAQVASALRALARMGEVEVSDFHGMGGGQRSWKLAR